MLAALLRSSQTFILNKRAFGPETYRYYNMASAAAVAGVKVNAAHVAAPFRDDIQKDVKALSETVLGGDAPLLVGFLANDDIAAKKYASWTKRACEKDGIKFELRECARMNSRES